MKSTKLICDGCGRQVEWRGALRPQDWRLLTVTDGSGRTYRYDVCPSYTCASKAVEKSYELDDLMGENRHSRPGPGRPPELQVLRGGNPASGLHALPSQ